MLDPAFVAFVEESLSLLTSSPTIKDFIAQHNTFVTARFCG
jgi:hypothetical protein